ncbi:MAG: hypothetical protein JNK48_08290 [Bryobacterales bacterium]|nr:hypothetical protein [Bryobacterales bacterium]
MALFEAMERLYGVRADRVASIAPQNWTPPHPHAVRDFLLAYYSERECRAHGFEHYPHAPIAAIRPMQRPSQALPRASSVPPTDVRMPSLSVELLSLYTSALRHASLWDGETYRLLAFDAELPRGSFAIDSFLRFRLTNGLMREEMYHAVATGSDALPLRCQIAPDAAALLDFPSHNVCGGVHTLCAFARPAPHNDFIVPLQRRSPRVGVAGGSYGVIPMAFHQPTVSGPLDPREPATTALREIFEELFGGHESFEEAKFLDHPAIAWLLSHPDRMHFETTGFFVSLLGGNYDFSLLLAVTDTGFWQRFGHTLKTGWESGEYFLLSTLDGDGFHRILHQPDWEAQALACCLEGLRRLRSIDHKRMLSEPYDLTTS